ncbi:hypothetical protein [Streptomyces sp. NPDC015131]|uniref:hypothetical protein n=1 Tax=Streptomyces sp. NPDC015131 TaxID=3364941 RepID=UPI0036F97253
MIAIDFPEVPMPDRVAQMIGAKIPLHILQAEMDAETLAAEIRTLRPLASVEDQADREDRLADLHRANKVLGAYNPGLIVTPKAVTR